jgi:squalene-hopene/tetraprenyl-beta-curcumene cyclase
LRRRIDRASRSAVQYLVNVQRPDGAWTPLWFGNENSPDEENRVYGTSRVLRLIRIYELQQSGGPLWMAALRRATHWLLAAQKSDGGWGGAAGASSIEETALALEALAEVVRAARSDAAAPNDSATLGAAIGRGVDWLAEKTDRGRRFAALPIGFYFAKLWYFEKLYPLIYTVQALSVVKMAVALPAGAPRG